MSVTNPASQSGQSSLIRFNECTTKTIVLVGNSPRVILQPNPKRIYALVMNLTDVLVSLVCGDSPIKVDEGLALFMKGSQFAITPDDLFDGQVTAICYKSAKLAIMECNE